jgi:hypothetical protein
MRMGERVRLDRSGASAQRLDYPTGVEPHAGVDQHVADDVHVDQVAQGCLHLPDIGRKFLQHAPKRTRRRLAGRVPPNGGNSLGGLYPCLRPRVG